VTTNPAKILAALAIIYAGFVCVLWRGGSALSGVLQAARSDDFLSGRLAAKVDRAVFDAMPRAAGFDGLMAGMMYRLLGDAGAQVRAGCNDWLYSAEELLLERQQAENVEARLKMLPHLSQSFAERGILLVVVPIPDKAEQVEEQLCGLAAAQSRRRARLWAAASASIPIHQVDLRHGWPRPGYWRTDTHWDHAGARFAAELVASLVNDRLGPGTDRINLTVGATHERAGDLARLAGLTEAPAWLAPAKEYETEVRAMIQRTGGLLDEVAGPSVILAGSSFSLNSGFAEYLQAALSREVAQLSQAGGGFAGALLDILDHKPGILASAKVVIWEWPMRSLAAPLSDPERRVLWQEGDH